jgi:hypothetical protein
MRGQRKMSANSKPSVENPRWQIAQGSLYWKIPPPPGWGKYQPMSFGGNNVKRGRENRGKCNRKRKKGERIRKKGEEDEKRGIKREK